MITLVYAQCFYAYDIGENKYKSEVQIGKGVFNGLESDYSQRGLGRVGVDSTMLKYETDSIK
jgi:hypothetical protein